MTKFHLQTGQVHVNTLKKLTYLKEKLIRPVTADTHTIITLEYQTKDDKTMILHENTNCVNFISIAQYHKSQICLKGLSSQDDKIIDTHKTK